MTLLPDVGVLAAFGLVILVGCASVLVHDWIERGLGRRAARLRGAR